MQKEEGGKRKKERKRRKKKKIERKKDKKIYIYIRPLDEGLNDRIVSYSSYVHAYVARFLGIYDFHASQYMRWCNEIRVNAFSVSRFVLT